MTFARLRAWDWAAMLAALALLFTTAADWYSTRQGDEARRIERIATPRGAAGAEIEREIREDARLAGEAGERNAWQVDGTIDRIVLLVLLAAAGLALASGFLRAAGRRFPPPLTPSALAALAALLGALLVTYRLVQQPGFDPGTTVRSGGPLALAVLGALAFAAARALRDEGEGKAFRDPGRAQSRAEARPRAPSDPEGAPRRTAQRSGA